ncbi:MAG: glycosyltransferase [Betaproteobacteria bacterium HGW-Betaproteobacteria-10]|nr:MAG: glycosyltransferase [Betaproteobacteria bacterium HGW-Betaproteobacteria-10]
MKRILMIAYHFPPLAGSSGIQRTLRFVQHLPKLGWEPIVLTADPRAYERTSDDLMLEVPEGTIVKRAFALDTARHLSLKGRYIAALARPDRWMSWKFAGIRDGMRLIEKYEPDVIWSTYPIATAHVIAAELHRRSGLPWVADFRDPMAQDEYPADPITRQQFINIEKKTIEKASLSLFTTPGAARIYRQRYPESAHKIDVLENGYDEPSFQQAEAQLGNSREPLNPGAFTFLHSGIIYPAERDPTQLFSALAKLKQSHPAAIGKLKIRFRASVHDDLLHQLAKTHAVEAFIETFPAISYSAALSEMLQADGLLLMQAANCNDQIPAKVYEYLRAGKPILGLTDHAGDTANLLRNAGCAPIADLVNADEIHTALLQFIDSDGSAFQLPTSSAVESASRVGRTKIFAGVLNGLAELT